MASLPGTGQCGVCSEILETGQGMAIFTAACSHSFHVDCIGNDINNFRCPLSHGNLNAPIAFHDFSKPSRFRGPFRRPQSSLFNFSSTSRAVHDPEPIIFSDDESLPAVVDRPTLSGELQKVGIKTVPERGIVAASEVLPEFPVLLGLKAPPLLQDEKRASVDLVTVLDVSGSMQGSKLGLLKRAVHFVIDNMGSSDRLSIVSFDEKARRILPLRRMTPEGREQAKQAVDTLQADGMTNIVAALEKGAKVLEERRQRNPVANIIFLSDGNDTCHHYIRSDTATKPAYLNLLPTSIRPRNGNADNMGQQRTFPVHTFGFGTDHDPIAMHAIADSSDGTFSFIESYEMVQDAFASCIGGLLSVVAQDLNLTLRSASNGVEIKSISSGRYANEVSKDGSQGSLNVGDLYAEEEKEFLIFVSVPALQNNDDNEMERKTSLLDIACSYRDVVSKQIVHIECDLVEIQRPKFVSPQDMIINLEVDRQRNRFSALLTISEAQQMADTGNLSGAQAHLAKRRYKIHSTPSAQAGDGLCLWLQEEMKETEARMSNEKVYAKKGRAYALSGMSSHSRQRATTRGTSVAGAQAIGAAFCCDNSSAPAFGAYATPQMANMVLKSQQKSKTEESESSDKPF